MAPSPDVALSVIIPALNEQGGIGLLLDDLSALECAHEVIVVDGGSADHTVAIAAARGARTLRTERGRGTQLAAGARAATGRMLCFLHADVRVPPNTRNALDHIVACGSRDAHAFRFRIDAAGWRYRFIEFGARARVRVFALPYGDQGLVVSREQYDAVGGYRDLPLMEDVALVDALRRLTRVRSLQADLPVSARRWERDGPLTRMLRNWSIMIAYRLGASPHHLASRYLPDGDRASAGATRR